MWSYQLSKEVWWQSFGLNITVLSQATFLVSTIVSITIISCASPTILQALLPMMAAADKLLLEVDPDVTDNNMIFMWRPVNQTFVMLNW